MKGKKERRSVKINLSVRLNADKGAKSKHYKFYNYEKGNRYYPFCCFWAGVGIARAGNRCTSSFSRNGQTGLPGSRLCLVWPVSPLEQKN